MLEVLYWNGIIPFNASKFEEYKPLILRLLSGDTKGVDLDLKRANKHKIYSVKINDANRLLFTTVNHQILLLEIVLNHDYQKSRFLQSGVLKAFKDKHVDELQQVHSPIWFDDISLEALDLQSAEQTTSTVTYKPVIRYNDQFLSLTQEQFLTLEAPYPILLRGPPGSGKSLLAIELIAHARNERVSDDSLPVACVCRSVGVRDYLSKQYQQTPEAMNETQNVVFLTYDDLLLHVWNQSFNHTENKPSLVDKTDCLEFINDYRIRARRIAKSQVEALGEQFSNCDEDLIYQEFYLIATLSLEAYLAKGSRQTLFTDVDERRAVFDVFQRYQRYLRETNAIHPAFYAWAGPVPLFRKMIVDEAQDLSLLQLKQLLSVTENFQMACAMDPHQSLTVSHSLRVALTELLTQGRAKPSSYQLTRTHRCPRNVAQMANKILALKNHVFDGVSDKFELKQIQLDTDEKEGHIDWPDTLPNAGETLTQINDIRRKYSLKETDVALIVTAEDVERIKEETGLKLVFSPESIKGLEYKCVIVYDPLKGLNALNEHLPGHYEDGALTIKGNRAKKQSSPQKKSAVELSPQYAIKLNKVFVSLTRTSQYLVVWQSRQDKTLSRLIGHLKSVLLPRANSALLATSEKASAEPLSLPKMVEATRGDWLSECLRVYYSGNSQQAESIYKDHLKGLSDATFSDFLEGENALNTQMKPSALESLPAQKISSCSRDVKASGKPSASSENTMHANIAISNSNDRYHSCIIGI